jgi:uncharacterized protein with GYD domain
VPTLDTSPLSVSPGCKILAPSANFEVTAEEDAMGKYLLRGNYVGPGVAGLLKEGGTARRAAAMAAVESVGGSVDCMYFAFGDTDIFAICEFPDHASAAAFSLMVNASGAVTGTTTPLMTAEDLDEAAKKNPTYRPPGG